MKPVRIAVLLAACALSACDPSTTVRAASRMPMPLAPKCLEEVAAQSFGEQAIRRHGSTFPIGVNLAPRGQPDRFADVRQTTEPDGGTVLEIAVVWLGQKPPDLVAATEKLEVGLLRSILTRCGKVESPEIPAIECTRHFGRRSESGCRE
jgi:hypothetical protein